MIRRTDLFQIQKTWYDFEVEIFPCKCTIWRGRYYAEVLARTSAFGGGTEGMWVHYTTLDYHAWTLRKAWMKAYDAMGKLYDMMEVEPGRWVPGRWVP